VRILVLASDGFGGHGGIALYARNVLTALCAHPCRPKVIGIPRVAPLPLGPLPAGLTWDTRGLGSKARYTATVATAALEKCNLVVCTHVHLLPMAYAIAKLHRAPLVLFVYGIDVKQPTSKPLANRLLGRVDALISIRAETTRMMKSWADVDDRIIHQLENAIDLEHYAVGPKDPRLVEKYGLAGKTVVMTMGRVEESYKGFDEVIEAMPALSRQQANLFYVVAGGGYDVPRLQEKARSLGVNDRVVFTGLIDDSEKADHFRLADVFAMPGTGPGFDRYPLRFVFLEAMACGIPVVGARPEDEQEARTDGALLAEMVDPHDRDDVVRGIVAALARGKREVPAGLERFGFPSFQKRLHAIVDSVLPK
jgi:glycosyltransferase involved in cell wall biosynthesis